MPYYDTIFQYQIKTEIPFFQGSIPGFESTWHQQWSEPVRVRINPRLAIALIASGLFAPVLNPNSQITQNFESRWHYAWSEPVRLKRGTHPGLQSFSAFIDSPVFQLDARIVRYLPLSEPVWPKKGLKQQLQQTLAMPPRLLPTPNVIARMAATETNRDIALFGIDIGDNVPKPYVLFAGANVTVTEIPAISGGALSIEET